MKLIDRQLVLPVVISLSLTGVGAALLYYLYNKDGGSKKTTTRVPSSQQHEIQVRVPRKFVPAIIGRSGKTIDDIQEKTATKITFSAEETDDSTRICHIRGKEQCTHLAQLMIENIITNQPIIETYETYVPQDACGRIIGRGGDVIRNIQAISSAKVIVESSKSCMNPDAKTRVIIKGTAEHIAAALAMIEEKVLEQNNIRKQLDISSSSRLPRGQVSPRINTTVHTSDNQSESKDVSTATEGLVEVFVSAVDSPSQFWVQVVGSGSMALDKLVDEMTAYYNDDANTELHTLKNASIGQMVAAKFSVDEKWYRAEVVSELGNGQYEVYFVDYGDNQAVALHDLMELRTDFLSLRLQAIECSLANVKPRDGEWCLQACDKFAELSWVAQWKSLTAKVRGYKERSLARGGSRREGSPIPCIDLYDKTEHRDINIGKELVAAAIAEEEESSWSAASSTLSLTQRSSRESPISKLSVVSRHVSLPKDVATLSTEADLVKPKKMEMVDTVTPVRITPPLQKEQRNGSGDHFQNGSNTINNISDADKEGPSRRSIQPAGYESDFTDDSDSLELQ
ncbi:tudor and KH domain-containing protein homolog isoform X1 [Athalia rosae]|uniref:tudor and KH domain-containing protein homolog isoform X1 n=2 Tax=Athalia rosae TaxID=37344 RepID=UPI002033A46B|nr:tudor and KH domain-containing protein homolog isoform X1 [Athalia rosae]